MLTAVAVMVSRPVWDSLHLQSESAPWPQVAGQMRTSAMRTTRYRVKGVFKYENYADIAYSYQVADHTYLATRLRFWPLEPWQGPYVLKGEDGGRVQAFLSRFPKDSPVTVSYNPDDPATSVLLPGTTPLDAVFGLAPMMVDCLALAAWASVFLVRPREESVAGLRIVAEPGATRIVVDDTHPVVAAFMTAACLCASALFVVGLLLSNLVADPFALPPLWAYGIYGAVIVVSVGMGVSTARNRASGASDIVLGRTLSFVVGGRRSTPLLQDVHRCATIAQNKGYAVQLGWVDKGQPATGVVFSTSNRAMADELTAWLIRHGGIKMEPQPAVDVPDGTGTLFVYEGRDKNGRLQRQLLRANSLREATARLVSEGVTIINIRTKDAPQGCGTAVVLLALLALATYLV
jgi:hypothetical protein